MSAYYKSDEYRAVRDDEVVGKGGSAIHTLAGIEGVVLEVRSVLHGPWKPTTPDEAQRRSEQRVREWREQRVQDGGEREGAMEDAVIAAQENDRSVQRCDFEKGWQAADARRHRETERLRWSVRKLCGERDQLLDQRRAGHPHQDVERLSPDANTADIEINEKAIDRLREREAEVERLRESLQVAERDLKTVIQANAWAWRSTIKDRIEQIHAAVSSVLASSPDEGGER